MRLLRSLLDLVVMESLVGTMHHVENLVRIAGKVLAGTFGLEEIVVLGVNVVLASLVQLDILLAILAELV
jgi:hypothetical protein